jgi:hypothetical protein
MRRVVIAFVLTLFVSINILAVTTAEDFKEYERDTLGTLEYTTEYIRGDAGWKIHFVIEADGPLNIYIKRPDSTYYKRRDYVEKDFFDEDEDIIFSKENQDSYDFEWELPENRAYIFYIYNPNYGEVTYDLKYTDAYFETIDPVYLYLIIGFFIIVIIIVLIYLGIKRSRKTGRRKRRY